MVSEAILIHMESIMVLRVFVMILLWSLGHFATAQSEALKSPVLEQIVRNLYGYDYGGLFQLEPWAGTDEEVYVLLQEKFEELNQQRCGDACLNNQYKSQLLERDAITIGSEFRNFTAEELMMANYYLSNDPNGFLLIYKGNFNNGTSGCDYHLIYDKINYQGFIGMFNCH